MPCFSAANGLSGISTSYSSSGSVGQPGRFSAANGLSGISTSTSDLGSQPLARRFSAANGLSGISTPATGRPGVPGLHLEFQCRERLEWDFYKMKRLKVLTFADMLLVSVPRTA